MKLGVQIYGSMPEFRKDPEAFCAQLAAAGYTQIEPVVALNMTAEEIKAAGMNPVWLPEETAAFKKLLERYGLELTSCHIFGDPEADAEKAVKLCEEHGIKQIVVNCPHCETEADFAAFADKCLVLVEKLNAIDVALWIHNSFPEIRAKVNGETALEYILKRCGGKVGTQIDVGWVLFGGEDPMEYLKKVKPYLTCIHYKDICKEYAEITRGGKLHVPLGKGAVDWRAVKAYADANQLPEIIDQDLSYGDFLKDLTETAELLKNA